MAYVKLDDLITWAYWTWCFSFDDLDSDLYDVLKLALNDGITFIGIDLGSGKVISLLEYDLCDLVDELKPYVMQVLDEIKNYDENL
jgi:hypothetical protein